MSGMKRGFKLSMQKKRKVSCPFSYFLGFYYVWIIWGGEKGREGGQKLRCKHHVSARWKKTPPLPYFHQFYLQTKQDNTPWLEEATTAKHTLSLSGVVREWQQEKPTSARLGCTALYHKAQLQTPSTSSSATEIILSAK